MATDPNSRTDNSRVARQEWRAHWPVPVVSLVGLVVAFTHVYVFGVLLAPIQHELGWSRAAISGGLTIVSVISVVFAPFTGSLIDRFGSRRIALPGLLLFCGSFAALSLTGASIWTWWLIWLFVGLGSVCTKPTVWGAAIGTRFDKGRGAAMSVALCGSGLGGMFLPLLTTILVKDHGWRVAVVTIGLVEAVITLPIIFLFFHDRPGLDRRRKVSDTPAAPPLAGLTPRVALRSGKFIRLAIATLLVTVALLALTVPLVPILVDRGLTPQRAAATAGLVGMSMIVGRIVTGFMLDRFSGPLIGAGAFGLPIVVCLLLRGHGTSGPAPAALLLGLSVGSEVDVIMFMASRYFGLRHFGVMYGTLNGLTSLGTGLGPLLSGYIFDRYGSYDPVFTMLIPVFVTAMLLIASMGRYPDPAFRSRDDQLAGQAD